MFNRKIFNIYNPSDYGLGWNLWLCVVCVVGGFWECLCWGCGELKIGSKIINLILIFYWGNLKVFWRSGSLYWNWILKQLRIQPQTFKLTSQKQVQPHPSSTTPTYIHCSKLHNFNLIYFSSNLAVISHYFYRKKTYPQQSRLHSSIWWLSSGLLHRLHMWLILKLNRVLKNL